MSAGKKKAFRNSVTQRYSLFTLWFNCFLTAETIFSKVISYLSCCKIYWPLLVLWLKVIAGSFDTSVFPSQNSVLLTLTHFSPPVLLLLFPLHVSSLPLPPFLLFPEVWSEAFVAGPLLHSVYTFMTLFAIINADGTHIPVPRTDLFHTQQIILYSF